MKSLKPANLPYIGTYVKFSARLPLVLGERHRDTGRAARLGVELRVVVEVVAAADADREDVGDVVVQRQRRAGVADELIVERHRPRGLHLETVIAERVDLLHGVHLLVAAASWPLRPG